MVISHFRQNDRPLYTSALFLKIVARVVIPAFFIATNGTAQIKDTISADAGWNLISISVAAGNLEKNDVFPGAVSLPFGYDGNYNVKDTICNGAGFWIKFDSAQKIVFSGEVVQSDTFEVKNGWNIIGSLTYPVPVEKIYCEPRDIIISEYYGYGPGFGYEQADTIRPGKGYWVKVKGPGILFLTSCSTEDNIKPCPSSATVDYDGKIYNTVLIGNQCWLRENLNIGVRINGGMIPDHNGVVEKYCYDDDSMNCMIYGGLYSWDEAMRYSNSAGVQGICPEGWHIPTAGEFETLSAAVLGSGTALMSVDDGCMTNSSGYTALPAGGWAGSSFQDGGASAIFWSSTESDSAIVNNFALIDGVIAFDYNPVKKAGYSVRCIKGEGVNIPPDEPSGPAPADNSANIDIDVVLSWSSSDPDGDLISYDVYFGINNPPSAKISYNQRDTFFLIQRLNQMTTYYWKIAARDSDDDSVPGPVWAFTTRLYMDVPCPGIPKVVYEGNEYNTVQIGSQCWLRENLNLGAMIQGPENGSNDGRIEKYCYGNDTANCRIHGGLYQWSEALYYSTVEGVQGICPPGWHIPTYGDFETLNATVGGDGKSVKAIGQGSGNGTGTNTSGFSAFLSGNRNLYGLFTSLGDSAYFLSSSGISAGSGYYLILGDTSSDLMIVSDSVSTFGSSVRCIMGEGANVPPGQPYNPSPADEAESIGTTVRLSWSCKDLNGDALRYDVYFGPENRPFLKVSEDQRDTFLIRTGLGQSTTYLWKIVAKDPNNDSTQGNILKFKTGTISCPGINGVSYAGKYYHTVLIGTQCWLKENLDIGIQVPAWQGQSDNDTIEKYCYNDDPNNCILYGGLYQWDESMKYNRIAGGQGLCPPGWHIPTYPEGKVLSAWIAGDANSLKAISEGTGSGSGTNTSGFSALLVGYRNYNGVFYNFGYCTDIWSSSESNDIYAIYLNLKYNNNYTDFSYLSKNDGFSIRCLKDN